MRGHVELIPYEDIPIELLYEKYLSGELQVRMIPPNLGLGKFRYQLQFIQAIADIWAATYNCKYVAFFEARYPPREGTEIHICWLSKSPKVRFAVGLKILEEFDEVIAYVPKHDSAGHFALARRGVLEYAGEEHEMNKFIGVKR